MREADFQFYDDDCGRCSLLLGGDRIQFVVEGPMAKHIWHADTDAIKELTGSDRHPLLQFKRNASRILEIGTVIFQSGRHDPNGSVSITRRDVLEQK
ncbi:MAG: hypothetical protein KY449_07605 [Proteobacteria bacterium]|nr:hypothetical protein [Pseudomonadota bacterium]